MGQRLLGCQPLFFWRDTGLEGATCRLGAPGADGWHLACGGVARVTLRCRLLEVYVGPLQLSAAVSYHGDLEWFCGPNAMLERRGLLAESFQQIAGGDELPWTCVGGRR